MGEYGAAALVSEVEARGRRRGAAPGAPLRVLTHCNTGAGGCACNRLRFTCGFHGTGVAGVAMLPCLAHASMPSDRPRTHTWVTLHVAAGSLACGGWGTALGIIRTLAAQGKLEHAYCTETRPYNQGAQDKLFNHIPFHPSLHNTPYTTRADERVEV